MHVKCAQNYIYTTVFKTKAIKEKFPCTIHVCIKILKEGSFDNQLDDLNILVNMPRCVCV